MNTEPGTQSESPLADYAAQMAVDCINALAIFQAPGGLWREYEVALELRRELGRRPRRSCARGVAVCLTRALARRQSLPWPTLEELGLKKGNAP